MLSPKLEFIGQRVFELKLLLVRANGRTLTRLKGDTTFQRRRHPVATKPIRSTTHLGLEKGRFASPIPAGARLYFHEQGPDVVSRLTHRCRPLTDAPVQYDRRNRHRLVACDIPL